MKSRPVGKCPMCKGIVREQEDSENRKWGECDRCGARVPMYTEPHIIGNPVTPTK